MKVPILQLLSALQAKAASDNKGTKSGLIAVCQERTECNTPD